jgi:hypothetical protein
VPFGLVFVLANSGSLPSPVAALLQGRFLAG